LLFIKSPISLFITLIIDIENPNILINSTIATVTKDNHPIGNATKPPKIEK